MLPATAGMILTGEQLQAYTRCSEYYSRGGSIELEPPQALCKLTFEYMISSSIRKPIEDPVGSLSYFVNKCIKRLDLRNTYLTGQVNEWERATVLWSFEFFKLFPPDKYFPLTGPIKWRVKVSKTPVDISVSAIFITKKNQTLHAVYFSPYYQPHSQINDPVPHLIMKTLSNVLPKKYRKEDVRIHIVTLSDKKEFVYNTLTEGQTSPAFLNKIEMLVKQIESGLHYPIIPCPYACQFKSKCFPEFT